MDGENTAVQGNPNLGALRPSGEATPEVAQEVVAEQPQTPEVTAPSAPVETGAVVAPSDALVPPPAVEETVENSTGAVAGEAVQS